jgi:WD40 repeat protein
MILPLLLLFAADPAPEPARADELRHGAAVTHLLWSADGKSIVTGTLLGVVTVWDAQTGKEIAKLPGHVAAITGLVVFH